MGQTDKYDEKPVPAPDAPASSPFTSDAPTSPALEVPAAEDVPVNDVPVAPDAPTTEAPVDA